MADRDIPRNATVVDDQALAESEALRRLIGHPRLTSGELMGRLDVDADTYLGAWSADAPLPPDAAARLLRLLDIEIDRMTELRATILRRTATEDDR